MNARKILIVDRERPVVEKLATALNQNGYHATSTDTSLPIPTNLRHNHYDLIAFGQNTSPGVKQCYEDALKLNNPGIIAVTGMSPSAPVVADQVNMAFNRRQVEEKLITYLNYDINEGCLAVMMHIGKECDAEISLYRIGMFYGTTENLLFSAKLSPGERFIKFEEKALSGFGAKFMVIRVNKKVFYMQRL